MIIDIFRKRSAVITLGLLFLTAASAQEAKFPQREVTLVVPYTAGGAVDVLARALADRLSKEWGKAVVMDNRPGGGGSLAGEYLKHAAPDGHTLLFEGVPVFVTNKFVYQSLPFDPETDFAPVTKVAEGGMGLVIHKDVPATTLDELVKELSAHPKKYRYASSGLGTSVHLAFEDFSKKMNVEMLHVPYKGQAQVMQDLIGGRIHAVLTNGATAVPFIKDGTIRMLAYSGAHRAPAFPDVPTFEEAGYGNFNPSYFFGIVAPSGTPSDIVRRIAETVTKVVLDKQFTDVNLTPFGMTAAGGTPAEFDAFLKSERRRMKTLVEEIGIEIK
jgi:tripartite-type tricarboxylate transporter receptor subunit TctC